MEVRSPDQPWVQTTAKCGVWIAHRVPVVWGIDPEERTVVVFRSGLVTVHHGPGEVATAEPRLPGFAVPVDALFAGLGCATSDVDSRVCSGP